MTFAPYTLTIRTRKTEVQHEFDGALIHEALQTITDAIKDGFYPTNAPIIYAKLEQTGRVLMLYDVEGLAQ